MNLLKPFNLEQAIAGKPVQTRDGRDVTQITLFNISDTYQVLGVVNKLLLSFTISGEYHIHEDSYLADLDLFMKEEVVEAWINLYGGDTPHFGQRVFLTEEDAQKYENNPKYTRSIKISTTISTDEETK